jgi:hypothetical protein
MSMKLNYEALIHEIRCAVAKHYESLENRLESVEPSKQSKHLAHLEAYRLRDNGVVDEFTALVNRYFPDTVCELFPDLPQVL